MSDVLSPEQAQVLVRRLHSGEALTDEEAVALAEFRRVALQGWQELTASFAGVTEEEILAAYFEDERRERELALKAGAGKLRSHARPRRATPAPRS